MVPECDRKCHDEEALHPGFMSKKRRAVIAATALETWGRQWLWWAMSGAKCPHPIPSFNEQYDCWRPETDKALKIGGAC